MLWLIILVLSLRPLYLALTFFLSTDILVWRESVLPWERPILRFLAEIGMSKEEKARVAQMRDRIKRGLPPF